MRRLPLAAALLLPAVAFAQQPAQSPTRPPLVQTPNGPESLQPAQGTEPPAAPLAAEPLPAPAAPAPAPRQPPAAPGTPPPAPTSVPPPPNVWLPKQVAELIGLDKLTARTTPITARVGQAATYGALTIVVRACQVRPPDRPADAAAFLDITDTHPGGPQFHGWMILSAPSVSMLQDPSYDVRLAGCHD